MITYHHNTFIEETVWYINTNNGEETFMVILDQPFYHNNNERINN